MAMIHKLAIVGFDRPANAKVKRARRGMEKDWNRYDEPLKRFMQHGDSMKKSSRWLEYRKRKFENVVDKDSEI
jgi:hypothetical protein